MTEAYTPPKVWKWEGQKQGRFTSTNRPIAGATHDIFPSRTCDLIHEATGGVPRLINILCDLCLVYGYSDEARVIDDTLLREFLASAKSRGIYTQFAPIRTKPTLVQES